MRKAQKATVQGVFDIGFAYVARVHKKKHAKQNDTNSPAHKPDDLYKGSIMSKDLQLLHTCRYEQGKQIPYKTSSRQNI